MSLLSDFVTAASPRATAVIGTEALTIGGGAVVDSVMSEIASGRQFMDAGFDPETSLSVVCSKAKWLAAGYAGAGISYVGKLATARGLTFRVQTVKIGAFFVEIALSTKEKA